MRPTHRLKNPVRHPGGAQLMLKSCMNCGRKGQIRRPQLFDAPEPLEFGSIHELDFERKSSISPWTASRINFLFIIRGFRISQDQLGLTYICKFAIVRTMAADYF